MSSSASHEPPAWVTEPINDGSVRVPSRSEWQRRVQRHEGNVPAQSKAQHQREREEMLAAADRQRFANFRSRPKSR